MENKAPLEGDLLMTRPGTFGYCIPKMLESMISCDLKLLGLPNTVVRHLLWDAILDFGRLLQAVRDTLFLFNKSLNTVAEKNNHHFKHRLRIESEIRTQAPQKKTYTCFSCRTTWENSTPTIISAFHLMRKIHFIFPSDVYKFPIWHISSRKLTYPLWKHTFKKGRC